MSGLMSRPSWRAWSAFRIAVILMVAAVIGMAGVLTMVSRAIDTHQITREEELAERRLRRALESIGEDLTGASVWDEAVQN